MTAEDWKRKGGYFPLSTEKREAISAGLALVMSIRMQKLLRLVSIKPVKHYAKGTSRH